jgi:hypothetical protein
MFLTNTRATKYVPATVQLLLAFLFHVVIHHPVAMDSISYQFLLVLVSVAQPGIVNQSQKFVPCREDKSFKMEQQTFKLAASSVPALLGFRHASP